ncbi:Protein tweety [Nymphon striatum]|nr:Protein tweety [Nymphon striatum]
MDHSVQEYQQSAVVEWFHNFPHVNISFDKVNATFNPGSDDYLEALGILASVPAFWLILTLLSFLIFFLVRCCQTNWKKKKNLKALKWILAIFSIICCCGISVGFYGNFQAHNGITEVEGSIQHVSDTLSNVKNDTSFIQQIIEMEMGPDLKVLDNIFSRPIQNASAHSLLSHNFKMLMLNVTEGLADVKNINKKIHSIHIEEVPKLISEVESYRWPATIAVLSLLLLICLMLIIGVARSSRPMFICFSVFGLLSVVLCWILVSAYLIICVGNSDFCKNPDLFYQQQVHSLVEKDILNYYMKCKGSTLVSPFAVTLKNGQKAVENIQHTITSVKALGLLLYGNEVRVPLDTLNEDISKTSSVLENLSALLYCESVHHDYVLSMNALCTDVVEGTSLMLLSAIVSGFLFTILIWIASYTWIYIRKKPRPEMIDEADPFLPPTAAMRRGRDTSSVMSGYSSGGRDTYGSTGYIRPRYTHTPPQTPHFATYGTSLKQPLSRRATIGCLMEGHYRATRNLIFEFGEFLDRYSPPKKNEETCTQKFDLLFKL